jgi:hypothetical protein
VICPVRDGQYFVFKIFFAPWFVKVFMLFSNVLGMRRVKMAFESYGKEEMFWIVPELNRRRYYCISVEPGLFGPMLIRSWGADWRSKTAKEGTLLFGSGFAGCTGYGKSSDRT